MNKYQNIFKFGEDLNLDNLKYLHKLYLNKMYENHLSTDHTSNDFNIVRSLNIQYKAMITILAQLINIKEYINKDRNELTLALNKLPDHKFDYEDISTYFPNSIGFLMINSKQELIDKIQTYLNEIEYLLMDYISNNDINTRHDSSLLFKNAKHNITKVTCILGIIYSLFGNTLLLNKSLTDFGYIDRFILRKYYLFDNKTELMRNLTQVDFSNYDDKVRVEIVYAFLDGVDITKFNNKNTKISNIRWRRYKVRENVNNNINYKNCGLNVNKKSSLKLKDFLDIHIWEWSYAISNFSSLWKLSDINS